MIHLTKEGLLKEDNPFRRNFFNGLSGFKSVNLIGTADVSGRSNLALFSQVFHVGANPPLVGILFRPDTVIRHTLDNIFDTGFFTLNQISSNFYKKAHWTSARWEASEFEATGLKEEFLNGFFAPFVHESKLKMSCRLVETQTIKANQTLLVVGGIEDVYLEDESLRPDGSIDLNLLDTVTVSGLDEYHVGVKLARLTYARPNQQVEEIED